MTHSIQVKQLIVNFKSKKRLLIGLLHVLINLDSIMFVPPLCKSSPLHELLKEIFRKERFLGEPHIKLRDTNDWNSILTTTDRIEKEKNRRIFVAKYGDSGVAFRSIASQSAYDPAASNQFRSREKQREIHRNMRFSSRSESFSNNRK